VSRLIEAFPALSYLLLLGAYVEAILSALFEVLVIAVLRLGS